MQGDDRVRKSQKTKSVVVSVGNSHPSGQNSNFKDARDIIQDARDEAYRIKKAAEEETRKIRQEVLEIEKRIAQKEESLEVKLTEITTRNKDIELARDNLKKRNEELSQLRTELLAKLDKVSSLTKDEAKKLILANTQAELQDEIAKRIKEAEEKIKLTAQEKAKEILVNAMMAGSTDWVAEYTVSTIKLESEDMKGRIIGKEGRNIRAFEPVSYTHLTLPTTPYV